MTGPGEWSRAAQPDGFPDGIEIAMDADPQARVQAVLAGHSDVALEVASANVAPLRTRFASQLRLHSQPHTSFLNFRPDDRVVEIGNTWLVPAAWGTGANTEAKYLLLEHAFDVLGCAVVGLRTDNFNFASQKAIAALGAHKDGVLRHHYPRRDGSARDSVMFSILSSEWGDVKRHLVGRMARHAE